LNQQRRDCDGIQIVNINAITLFGILVSSVVTKPDSTAEASANGHAAGGPVESSAWTDAKGSHRNV
jgi:hypothetical protein